MVRKETAPFDNPWLSAIDSTEKSVSRCASLNSASDRPRRVWLEHCPLASAGEKRAVRANARFAPDNLLIDAAQREVAGHLTEAHQQLLPTLARISQRLQAKNSRMEQTEGQDESVEVALRAARKRRAGRLK